MAIGVFVFAIQIIERFLTIAYDKQRIFDPGLFQGAPDEDHMVGQILREENHGIFR